MPLRLGLLLLSAGVLTFEVILTRLFSVAQFYHFAFMIISLALLGFGASGTFLALYPVRSPKQVTANLPLQAVAAGTTALGAYLLINGLPFDSYSMAWDPGQLLLLAVHYFALSLPFFFTGLAVAGQLAAFPGVTGQVYAMNLVGSALGCIVALVLPRFVGGEGTVTASAALMSLAALIALLGSEARGRSARGMNKAGIAQVLAVCLLLASALTLWLQSTGERFQTGLTLQISPYKGLAYALQYPGAEWVTQRWNAFSRVDLVKSTGVRSLPGLSFRYPYTMPAQQGIFVDADDLSAVISPQADLVFAEYMPSALPYILRPKGRALVLEPRGGLEVLVGVAHGTGSLTAVEPNTLVIEQAGPIYALPTVEAVIETGRSYLRRGSGDFDVLVIALTSSYRPVRSGAYSLSEDYRYTVEAFQDALDQLHPEGVLFVSRWLQDPPSEWLRTFGMLVAALEGEGLEPAPNIVAYRSFNLGNLLVKRTPFTPEELAVSREFLSARAFDLVYAPDLRPEEVNRYSILEQPVYYQTFEELLRAPSRQA